MCLGKSVLDSSAFLVSSLPSLQRIHSFTTLQMSSPVSCSQLFLRLSMPSVSAGWEKKGTDNGALVSTLFLSLPCCLWWAWVIQWWGDDIHCRFKVQKQTIVNCDCSSYTLYNSNMFWLGLINIKMPCQNSDGISVHHISEAQSVKSPIFCFKYERSTAHVAVRARRLLGWNVGGFPLLVTSERADLVIQPISNWSLWRGSHLMPAADPDMEGQKRRVKTTKLGCSVHVERILSF